ncbi:MAG: 1-deoxy-D-xylulose-5-phosphate synthase [candidate division Zixibacteria bacterium]|nr:1-deoxy-D-xylulose-5-phosphate synthase [candidate division Zixibacteria bacterium]
MSDPSPLELLPAIDSPADLKRLSVEELLRLCDEIRHYIIDVIGEVGGHFASSLGAVELTVALHYLYDTPRDRIVWDVGHQAYVHKILTGRRDQLRTIRRFEGISGFLRREESEYDTFGAGHASTAISAALGMAIARDRKGESYEVVAVVGDGGITGGLAYEGLNNAGASGTDITIILNDNRMSISPNVGAISRYLAEIITDPLLNRIRGDVWKALGKAPFHARLQAIARRVDDSLRKLLVPGMFFEDLGFRYVGPIDGHNLVDVLTILRKAKELKKPLLIHLITRKGCGHPRAEEDPVTWHGVKPAPKKSSESATQIAPVATAKPAPAYTDVFGQTMLQLAGQDPRVIAITAAMATGTGLVGFAEKFPDRFFDVGIAEGHAVTFAGGLATEGFRPVCAIYSTFLQRAFDHLVHDVAIQRLPVIFCVDRGGLAGEDGPTHHGNLDLAYLSCVPEMVVTAPKDGNELRNLLFTALAYDKGPFAIRYPKDSCWRYDPDDGYTLLPIGQWERLHAGDDLCILAVGAMVKSALEVAERLDKDGVAAEVINARYVKPLDEPMLEKIARRHRTIVTIEEANRRGGFGQAVAQNMMTRRAPVTVHAIGVEDCFVPHGARPILLDWAGLSAPRLEKRIRGFLDQSPTSDRAEPAFENRMVEVGSPRRSTPLVGERKSIS